MMNATEFDRDTVRERRFIDELRSLAKRSDSQDRPDAAVVSLLPSDTGGKLSKVVEACRKACRSKKEDQVRAALRLLSWIASKSAGTLGYTYDLGNEHELFAKAAASTQTDTKIEAIRGIEQLESGSDRVLLNAVLNCLPHPAVEVQLAAIRALRTFGQDMVSAGVMTLGELVRESPCSEVRVAACEAIGWLEADGRAAVNCLIEAIAPGREDEKEVVALAAARALVVVDPEGVIVEQHLEEIDSALLTGLLRSIGPSARQLRQSVERHTAAGPMRFRSYAKIGRHVGLSGRQVGRLLPKWGIKKEEDGFYDLTEEQLEVLRNPDKRKSWSGTAKNASVSDK